MSDTIATTTVTGTTTATATVEIKATALTLLVLPAGQVNRGLVHAYPVDLNQITEDLDDQFDAICETENIEDDQVVIVGVEFDDPEQFNTRVTLSTADLAGTRWLLGDKTVAVVHDSAAVLRHLSHVTAIEIPAYS